jgi:hypothetical protein
MLSLFFSNYARMRSQSTRNSSIFCSFGVSSEASFFGKKNGALAAVAPATSKS